MEIPTPDKPNGLPITFRELRGNTPVAIAAVLRPSSRPGRWLVWPDNSAMCHRYDSRGYWGQQSRKALDNMYDFEAARRYPEHAEYINSRPDSSD